MSVAPGEAYKIWVHHLAIIPDGNRRWAKARGENSAYGHEAGFRKVMELTEGLFERGLSTLTLWLFSTENWGRSAEEVNALMQLYDKMLNEHLPMAERLGICMTHIGRKDRIPAYLLATIEKVERLTAGKSHHFYNFALDYGSHYELCRMCNRTIEEVAEGTSLMTIEEKLNRNTSFSNQPYPDMNLIIRTSGEQRVSGFMPWHSQHAELAFVGVHMPDLTIDIIEKEIASRFPRRKDSFSSCSSLDDNAP